MEWSQKCAHFCALFCDIQLKWKRTWIANKHEWIINLFIISCNFSETIKFTRLETRTKESHLYARIRGRINTLIRNESEISDYQHGNLFPCAIKTWLENNRKVFEYFKVGVYRWGPERWWTILGEDKARGNSGGSSSRC